MAHEKGIAFLHDHSSFLPGHSKETITFVKVNVYYLFVIVNAIVNSKAHLACFR